MAPLYFIRLCQVLSIVFLMCLNLTGPAAGPVGASDW